uniref:Uncharacterized protein n=1 Tax=Arundo donax TaxID=35708 RepID=A0A0A9EWH6_ARUDO
MIALFVIITPFGSPVVPLVYMIVQISSFCFLGSSWSFSPIEENSCQEKQDIPNFPASIFSSLVTSPKLTMALRWAIHFGTTAIIDFILLSWAKAMDISAWSKMNSTAFGPRVSYSGT